MLGANLGYQTSQEKVLINRHPAIVYQTQKITSLKYLKPLVNNTYASQHGLILILDEIHADTIETQEQLSLVREILKDKKHKSIPFIIL